MRKYVFLLAMLALACSFSNAYIVVNSLNYEDVASTSFYANLAGEEVYYITPATELNIATLKIGPRGDITMVESQSSPVLPGLNSSIKMNGGTVKQTIISSGPYSFNLEMARLSGATSFIITDPSYPYNTVSLFAYAKASKSFVVFMNKDSAAAAASFLASKGARSVMVFGAVDQETKDALTNASISTTQIDNGDKYLDNVQMLNLYYSSYDSQKQILMADGDFYDPSITSGAFPVMLVSNEIPQQSTDFITSAVRNGKVSVAVLIKPDYTSMVYNLMKTINAAYTEKKFSVFVKMGQGTATQGTPSPLDVYPLPAVVLDVHFVSMQYNSATKQLELVLENNGSIATFTKSTIKVYSGGQLLTTVGDKDVETILKGQSKGYSYPLTISDSADLSANLTTFYSSSRYTFERGFTVFQALGKVAFVDDASLNITRATYDPAEDKVSVRATNTGSKDAYFRVSVNYSTDSGSSSMDNMEVHKLSPGQSTVVQISNLLISPQELSTLQMTATAFYGGREAFLVNQVTVPVEVVSSGPDWLMIAFAILLLLLILAIIYWLLKRKGEQKPAPVIAAPPAVPLETPKAPKHAKKR